MKVPLIVTIENPDLLTAKLTQVAEAMDKAVTPAEIDVRECFKNIAAQVAQATVPQSEGGLPQGPYMPVRALAIFASVLDGTVVVDGRLNVTALVKGHNLEITTHGS